MTTVLTGVAHATPAAAVGSSTQYELGLEQLIKSPTMVLRGVDSRSGMAFGQRADERIEKLTLDLALTQSPALIDQLSHVNVLLNGKFVETVALKRESASTSIQTQVPLPVAGIKPYNMLELQLIGHYTMGCEDPLHKDLWIQVEPSSKLIFDVERLALPNLLGMLPVPFFDERDFQTQPLAFVLGTPSEQRLEAAGIVASWFGALASYRGTNFSVTSQGAPEKGHGIVILAANESLAGVTLPPVQGPTLAVRTNPKDPAGKLLIITGRNDDEIRRAAVALTLGGQTLSGTESLIQDVIVPARKPYDAPSWIPTDRPVYFGELLPTDQLTVSGYDAPAINIPLQLPPDLSGWKTPEVPLQLNYRYTPLGKDEDSKLTVFINYQFAQAFKLGDANDGLWGELTKIAGIGSQAIPLPLDFLESQSQLQFKFTYPDPARAECSGVYIDPRLSSLDPNSTIDFSGLPHHLAMPDLAAFRNAAFPFSRMADLSETVVLLSEQAQQDEYAAFLTVLGKIGQSTLYPASGLRVQRQASNLDNKDILIISGNTESGILSQWASHMPKPSAPAVNSTWGHTLTRLFESRPFASHAFEAPSNGIYIAGFESPVTSGRSVVVIASNHARNLPNGAQELLFNAAQAKNVQGSLVTVRTDQIETLSTDKSYYVGNLGVYQQTLWYLSKHPSLLLLIFLISAVVLAVVLFLSLRARAQGRLLIGADEASSPKNKE